MKTPVAIALALAVTLACAGGARADGFDRLGAGAKLVHCDSKAGLANLNAMARRKVFAQVTHCVASTRAKGDASSYAAVVRRTLNWVDQKMSTRGDRLTAAAVKNAAATASMSPSPADLSRDGQDVTRRRLALQMFSIKVINGVPVDPGIAQEVVAVTSTARGGGLCSGTVISSTAVLTAAHCVCGLGLAEDDGVSEKQVVVTHDLHTPFPQFQQRFSIAPKKTRLYPGASCSGDRLITAPGGLDIAIIGVSTAISDVPPVKLATGPELESVIGRDFSPLFVVYGFGCDRLANGSGTLGCAPGATGRKTTGLIWQAYQCGAGPNGLPDDPLYGSAKIICSPDEVEVVLTAYGAANPVDTCNGDSGGPAFLFGSGETADYRLLVGVTSRALDPNGTCGPGGIYPKVTRDDVRTWIDATVEEIAL